MRNYRGFYFIVVAYSIANSMAAKVTKATPNLDSYYRVCYRSNPKLKECMKNSLEKLKPFIQKGIPEIRFPSFDPYFIEQQITGSYKRNTWYAEFILTQLYVWRLSEFQIKDVRVHLGADDHLILKVKFPSLSWRSNYQVRADVSLVPWQVGGTGLSEGNCTGVEGSVLLKGNKHPKNNITYFHVEEIYFNFDILYFRNLDFRSTSVVCGKQILDFLNEGWKKVVRDLKPLWRQMIGRVVKELFNTIYGKFPMK